MFDISFIRFGSRKVKLQLLFGDESVLKVCKLNTNYDIKLFWKETLPNVHQKMFCDK